MHNAPTTGAPGELSLGGAKAASGVAPLILITTVDIGDGQCDKIEVREGDEPVDLARVFVHKHSLPEDIIPALAQHLVENLKEAAAAAALKQQQVGRKAAAASQRTASNGGLIASNSQGSSIQYGEE